MIGESLDKYIEKNKKVRTEKAQECLDLLREFTDEDIKKNPCDFLGTLSFLLELINAKDPYDIISLEEIGTDQKEIRSFEEKSVIIEINNNCRK